MTEPPLRTLVCVPTYDEADSLPRLLHHLAEAAPEVDILVIDDDSPDGTGRIADEFAAADEHIQVLHRSGKGGLGGAYLAGFAWGLDHGYDALVEMDADGSHRAEDLPALLAALSDADLVLGTRWMPGGRTVHWPLRRRLLSRAGNRYARAMLHLPIRDITGGFRVYRSAALLELDLPSVDSQGYCFQIELAARAARAGLRIREVPITFVEREQGVSKMDRAIVLEAMRLVTVWGVERILGRAFPSRAGSGGRSSAVVTAAEVGRPSARREGPTPPAASRAQSGA